MLKVIRQDFMSADNLTSFFKMGNSKQSKQALSSPKISCFYKKHSRKVAEVNFRDFTRFLFLNLFNNVNINYWSKRALNLLLN